MTRSTWSALAFPAVLATMLAACDARKEPVPAGTSADASATQMPAASTPRLLATPVQFWLGARFFIALQRPFAQGLRVRHIDVMELGIASCAAIARRQRHGEHTLGLQQFPGQGVFAPATANDQNLHSAAL